MFAGTVKLSSTGMLCNGQQFADTGLPQATFPFPMLNPAPVMIEGSASPDASLIGNLGCAAVACPAGAAAETSPAGFEGRQDHLAHRALGEVKG